MIHFLIYGFMLFLRLSAIMIILVIPIMGLLNGMCQEWHEVVIVDSAGRDTGRRVLVNSSGDDVNGNHYKEY